MPRPKKTPSESPVRRFASEEEERAYWQETDTVGMVDWSRAERLRLPHLKPHAGRLERRAACTHPPPGS